MARRSSLQDQNDGNFDLSSIFIAREQQLDLFGIYLTRWKRILFDADPDINTPVPAVPSPNNKLQGLIVLLYGRGGFGKSTLLGRFHNMAQEEGRNIKVSTIVDWEFAVEGKRGLFNPPAGQEVDAAEYFRVLCTQFVIALEKDTKTFKAYQAAVKAVDEARKKASGVLESMQKDEHYAALRNVTVEGLMTLGRSLVPGSGVILDNPAVKAAADAGVEITAEQLSHLRARLHAALSDKLGDYLGSALRLGTALGRDLAEIARNFPLLIFFDTYEEVDEADHLLRIVMAGAGQRVGWVIAGRDNLWAGSEQRKRSVGKVYSYKEIISLNIGLAIDFNAGGVGAFTASDIFDYFSLLQKKAPRTLALPPVTEEGAERILEVTQGVPLAVRIAAGLYLEKTDLAIITEKWDGTREIVDVMVQRYLLHTRDDQDERMRLYGLAMLRRADHPAAIAAALGLSDEQAQHSYETELSRLQRRYSFIFTEKVQPTLHQEVRHFLRLWLLEHRKEPQMIAVNRRLKDAHETILKHLEAQRHYASLEERLQDDEWIGSYLDLTEQQFWLDPIEGVLYILPFMIAATFYRRSINKDAVTVGDFFSSQVHGSYLQWWTWASQSLVFLTRQPEVQEGLEALAQVVEQRCPPFPQWLPDYRRELEAALWWRLGKAYSSIDDAKALSWYERALTSLEKQAILRRDASRAARSLASKLFTEKKYKEELPILEKAIELDPSYANAYNNRGLAYSELKEHQRAIQDFDRAIELDPNFGAAYCNRSIAYIFLKEYQRAIQDCDRAIELDHSAAYAYDSRGGVYYALKEYQRAIRDVNHAIELDPNNAIFHADRGSAYHQIEEYQRAIQDFDRAIEINPNYAQAYRNRGFAYLWLKNISQATADYEHSYELAPTNNNSAWMTEWIKMNKLRIDVENAVKLETNAAIAPESYTAYICRSIALGLRGKGKEGLEEVERAISLSPDGWSAYFWKAMLSAYYHRDRSHGEGLVKAVEQSLANGLPPILLTPLYWLQKDRPEVFVKYARPLLQQYGI